MEAGGPATISLQQCIASNLLMDHCNDPSELPEMVMLLEMAATIMTPFEGSNDKKKQGGGQQKVIEKLATLGSPKTDSLIV